MKHIAVLLFSFLFVANIAQAELLIIVNKNVSESTLSSQEIREIYLGKKVKWSDNTRINLVTSGDGTLHDDFLGVYIKRTPRQFQAYWKNMAFTGKGLPPKRLHTTKEIIDYVANTRGAIGYINSGSTTADIKKISVE